ncbi:nuclear transport factor 2 family protein [Xanthomonas hortorum]|uniref:nuclear transport factor 2 family protein n=1 Tax=Xanthomonas hortorum TaxID=56454 RepID=UPI0015932961|nr:nuclear transport factor 2 family protein [Xanthomonas hortorum]NHF65596.1 nuclear transport factor 2 family protein [Xanthomonas hortorum]
MPINVLAVAEQFSAAITSLDADAVAQLYTDDLVVQSNASNDTQTKDQNIAMLRVIFGIESEHGYHDIERIPTPDGFVQIHTFKPVFTDGSSGGEARVCMVAQVRDGKICRLREFLDGAQVGVFWSRVAEASKSA